MKTESEAACPPQRRSRIALLCALALALAGSAALAIPNAAVAAGKEKIPSVFVRVARPQELYELLLYPARVEPKVNAMVLADVDGVVTAIHAPIGTRVRAGQAVLSLRNVDPGYSYVALAVTSPVAGIVGKVDVTVGSRVARGDKLLLVTDPAQVRVTIEVAASDLRHLREGMLGELRVPGDDDPVKLRIKGVSPFVDPVTGTAVCELEVASKKGVPHPTPGLLGRVAFHANPRRGFLVAESAITYRGRDPFVRIVREGISRHAPVTLGRKQEGRVEITKGIKAGDEVVERASGFVADGERVTVDTASKDAAKEDGGTAAEPGQASGDAKTD